jgi:hypothetical protein
MAQSNKGLPSGLKGWKRSDDSHQTLDECELTHVQLLRLAMPFMKEIV